ncbi:MAG: hypothetical protein ACK5P8_03010 [Phycisphaerae bacterium]|jgi:hypothetical protein
MTAFIRDMFDVLGMRCEQHAVLVSRQADEPLRAGQACGLWLHLRVCKGCAQWRRQIGQLRALLRAIDATDATIAAMPGDARERIARKLGTSGDDVRTM